MDLVLFDNNLNTTATNHRNYALTFPEMPPDHPHFHQKPRKKQRTPKNLLKIITTTPGGSSSSSKPTRKPDPSAPKITRPCTECGKTFWSWKALFGHMRCHPERKWRGINPPPQFNLRDTGTEIHVVEEEEELVSSSVLTEEDHEVATCLLMLANTNTNTNTTLVCSGSDLSCGNNNNGNSNGNNVFECSSCKKVFGSHQALGGHRASHKNVKGCYAINRNFGDGVVKEELIVDHHHPPQQEFEGLWSGGGGEVQGHRCSVCWRVFSSGQALGGHMRCHWEPLSPIRVSNNSAAAGLIDLNNFPIQQQQQQVVDHHGLALDLRLGL